MNNSIRAIFLILLLIFLYLVRDILAIFLLSVVIASAIEPLAHRASRYRIPRVLTVLAVYLTVFSFLSFAFYFIAPILFEEFSDFISTVPSLREGAQIQTLFGLAPNLPRGISGTLVDFAVNLQSTIEKFTAGFFKATSAIFGGAFSFVLIIIISFYLSVQEHGIEKFLRIITPRQHEEYVLDLWMRSQSKIGRWLQGQFLLGVLVGLFVFLGLTILGVKYALTFAMIAAVFELIPIFGPILAALPAIAVAFLQSPFLALEVTVLYIVIQQFESHLIHPVVVKKITGVPPIITIIALIIGGKLGGIVGILLAVPIAVVIIEILNDLALKKQTA